MDSNTISRSLLIFGALIALVGAGILIVLVLPPFLGRPPGDISFQRDGFSFFFPIVTRIVLSVILTLAANVVIRLFR